MSWVGRRVLLLCCVLASMFDTTPRFREAGHVQVAQTLLLSLKSAPMPVQGRPDVAVHLPRGFDPARRPLVLVYFHGWNGCVGVALANEDAPCSEDGAVRRASRLASQVDEAGVNALLIAVELRGDAPSGEVGALAEPGTLRTLVGEVFSQLAPQLGVMMDIGATGGIVVLAHSGGYQAAAASVSAGDLPLRAIVLLDALYGADAVFDNALQDRALRVVNLYTYSGGTRDRSLSFADKARRAGRDVWIDDTEVDDDDGNEVRAATFAHEIVVKRVSAPHADVPRTYMRAILQIGELDGVGRRLAP
jgi:hypothetical protein